MEAYMRIIKRHKRCPYCTGIRTRKHSIMYRKRLKPDHAKKEYQRWYCYACNKTFSNTGLIHSKQYAAQAAEHYFVGRASYRNIARILNIHRMTAYRHVQELCQRAKMPWELSTELKPTWSGYLLIDSDAVIVNNRKEYLIVAVDSVTRDIPAAILTKEQGVAQWGLLLSMLKDISYPFQAIVSDGFPPIHAAIRAHIPTIPHQLCVRHYHDSIFRVLRYRPHREKVDPQTTEIFMRHVHDILFAPTIGHYRFFLDKLLATKLAQHRGLRDQIFQLQHHYRYLTPHFFNQNIPRTTNIVENVFSQLDLKLNSAIKFGSHESAWNTAKCLISWYRFKKFSSCCKTHRCNNGKAPLELAGVKLKNTSWIYQAIRQF